MVMAERHYEASPDGSEVVPDYPELSAVRNGGVASARDFSASGMMRARTDAPGAGWRRVIYSLTGGAVNLGPSTAELRRQALVDAVRAPVSGCRRIAVVSRKGGVGKTTTTLNLGHTFAQYRGDRVIALDGNPDAGSLGYRVPRETDMTITHLLTNRDHVSRYSDIRAFTSQAPSRLEVIAADDDPRITDALGEEDYKRAVRLLEVHYNLLCMDTGTGVLESAAKGILQLADQIVLVTGPSLDSGRAASATLDWLEKNGYAALVGGSVAVINGVRAKGLVDLDRVQQHFEQRCRAVVRIPWDPALDAGTETGLEELRQPTREAYLELAADVAASFADEGRRS
jgi:putative peptide zinc metalloprotease protein